MPLLSCEWQTTDDSTYPPVKYIRTVVVQLDTNVSIQTIEKTDCQFNIVCNEIKPGRFVQESQYKYRHWPIRLSNFEPLYSVHFIQFDLLPLSMNGFAGKFLLNYKLSHRLQ